MIIDPIQNKTIVHHGEFFPRAVSLLECRLAVQTQWQRFEKRQHKRRRIYIRVVESRHD